MVLEAHSGRESEGSFTRPWQTPGGHIAQITYREGTSDWNTVSACLTNPYNPTDGNEYHLPYGLSGWALDLGAHIGAVTVGLLLDNPDLRVLAIEAVPENAALVQANVDQNGVADRAIVWNRAAWNFRGTLTVEFDYAGSETAEQHRWIGSVSPWISDAPRRYSPVKTAVLADALRVTKGAGFVWVKSDCEGCEHPFFQGKGLAKLGTIEGEWHRRDGTPESFAENLSATHDVTWGEGIGGGPFKAVPK